MGGQVASPLRPDRRQHQLAPRQASVLPGLLLTGVAARTSSPLRIPRGRDLQSLNVRGLYPAGEGAGYAGGIMSAGVDGIEVAEALGRDLLGVAFGMA